MPQEIKQLLGAMNLDDPNEVIGKGFHRTARNVRFRGTKPNMRTEIVPGNIKLVNSFLPGTGTNLTIGRYYDDIKKRIFFFNYNSGGLHGIYILNTGDGTFQRLIQTGTNTTGDPLGFSANVIYNIDIIYGDAEQGDILYFLDTQQRPTKININRALAGGYGSVRRSFVDVAKEPSDFPPYVVYEDDATVTVNDLRKKLFKFKIRWVFDDQDKSVTSSQSELPLPYDAFNTVTDADPTKNCRLAIVYPTGPTNVRKVELLASISLGNVFSDFFLIASLDKTEEGIPSNDFATYLFYNDKGYRNIIVEESNQLFDYVPQMAVAQALLNGNVLGYGSVTEGYPNLTDFSNGTSTSVISPTTSAYYAGRFFSLMVVSQDGKSGFGSGNIHFVVRGRVTENNLYSATLADGSDVSYGANSGDDTSDVIEGLRQDAISKGYAIVSTGDNDLYITKFGAILVGALLIPNSNVTTGENVANNSLSVYDWWSTHGFGLIYYDEKGRTNGAVYTDGFSVSSLPYSEANPPIDIPRFVLSIYHRPPTWATYFQWSRTKDTTKSKLVQWISDRTFKDTATSTGQTQYAYIGIESMNQFKILYPNSPLGYGFAPNDRIRFIKRMASDGSTLNLYAQKDFEIVASEINPAINGVAQTGQFVKIVLPTTDGNFDFGVSGFENYFIELYTPAQSVANGLEFYYEFGERYAIANAGTSTAFHQGMLQNQTSDLVTPATFEFTKGDYFIRRRSIQTGNIYSFTIPDVGGSDSDTFLVPMNFIGSTYNDPNIIAQSVPYQSLTGSFNPGSDTRRFIQSSTQNTFKIEGTIVFSLPDGVAGDSWKYYLEDRYGNKTEVVAPFSTATAGLHTHTINATVTLNNNWLFLIAASTISQTRQVRFISGNLKATVDRTINQYCIDPNFSDYYPSAVNSNGRAVVYDADANRVNFPVMMRWGGAYQADTNINNSNRFYPQNFTEYNRANGAIKRFGVFENTLTIFQERKTAVAGIYARYIQNNDGNSELISTNAIITTNNFQYYAGDFGVSNQPDSVVQSGFVYYHVDPIKGKILRLSKDGYTDIGELYKVQTWAGANIPQYLKSLTYQYGGLARVTGTFNVWPDKSGEYMLLAQSGLNGSTTMFGETLSFNEVDNCFTSFDDIDCESILCAENVLYLWRNGEVWKLTNSTNVAFFFNSKKTASLTLVFNDQAAIKKNYMALAYQSNRTWVADNAGDVETNTVNSQTGLTQQSLIMEQDFEILEMPSRYASFNRDSNSMSNPNHALWEGDVLTGNLIMVKLSYSQETQSYLFAPYVTWAPAPRNF